MCMKSGSGEFSSGARLVRWYLLNDDLEDGLEEHIEACTTSFDSSTLPNGSWGCVETPQGETLLTFGVPRFNGQEEILM